MLWGRPSSRSVNTLCKENRRAGCRAPSAPSTGWETPGEPHFCFVQLWGSRGDGQTSSWGLVAPCPQLGGGLKWAENSEPWPQLGAEGEGSKKLRRGGEWKGKEKKKNSKKPRTKSLVQGCSLVFLWVPAAERHVPARPRARLLHQGQGTRRARTQRRGVPAGPVGHILGCSWAEGVHHAPLSTSPCFTAISPSSFLAVL